MRCTASPVLATRPRACVNVDLPWELPVRGACVDVELLWELPVRAALSRESSSCTCNWSSVLDERVPVRLQSLPNSRAVGDEVELLRWTVTMTRVRGVVTGATVRR